LPISKGVSGRSSYVFAEAGLIAVALNCFVIILSTGIAACFNLKFREIIMHFFNGVTLFTMIIFAAVITAAAVGTVSDLGVFKEFGADSNIGPVIVSIPWVAAVHMLAVFTLWLLMGYGEMQVNTAVKPKFTRNELELGGRESDYDYLMSNTRRMTRTSETQTSGSFVPIWRTCGYETGRKIRLNGKGDRL
jgi:hypothetical protein